MTDLFADLTAPVKAYPRSKSTIDRLLEDDLDPETADAVKRALLSRVQSSVLSKRLRERGMPVSPEMIRKYRMREDA